MSKNQKIVWSIYIGLLLFFFFFQPASFCYREVSSSSGGFGARSVNFCEDIFTRLLYFGWIPALILHIVLRDKKGKEGKSE